MGPGRSDAGERGRAAADADGNQRAQRRSKSAPAGRRLHELTRAGAEVHGGAPVFTWQMMADAEAYIAMTEDEYRRAGKLYRYDPDREWQKRIARIASRWPPPDGFIPEIGEYHKLIEDDERDDGVHQPADQEENID